MFLNAVSGNPAVLGWSRRVYVGFGFGEKKESDYLFDLARSKRDIFVLQVGANDGKRHDALSPFLQKFRWRGLLLEPLPDIFADLRRNYAGRDNVTLVNAALADRDGEMTFYRVKPGPGVPEGCSELGSFLRDVVAKHAWFFPEIEQHIVTEPITAYSFNTLVRKFDISKIDAVIIDTEGYDFEILKLIDFEKHRPKLVIYEHMHLSPQDRDSANKQLESLGYSVYRMIKAGDANTAAVLTSA